MPLQELLEVAIGLIFAWLVLSVATMQVQEWIASYLGWRAKDMEKSIRNMLGDTAWAEQLYQHPLIQSLSQKVGGKPSYIPANKFAVAIFDLVMTAGTDGSIIQRQLLAFQAKKPKSLMEFFQLVPARWWDQVLTWFTRQGNYLFGQNKKTVSMLYENLLEIASKADLSLAALEKLLEALGDDANLKKIEKLYPELAQALDDFYSKIPRRIETARIKLTLLAASSEPNNRQRLTQLLDLLNQHFPSETPDRAQIIAGIKAILADNNNLNLLKMLVNINYPTENTLEKLSVNLQGIVDDNPILRKALASLKLDLQDYAQKIDTLNEKALDFLKEREKHLLETRTEAENWFNDVMERTQGWYKRRAQVWSFVIGLTLAVILNVDSVDLANQLWREPAIRASLAATADKFISETNDIDTLTQEGVPPDQAIAQFQKRFEGLSIPFGWQLVSHPEASTCSLPASPEQTPGFYLPFSDYDPATPGYQNTCLEIANPPRSLAETLAKLLGILISAFAAMQGAPFWFDILKKLVNVRGTGSNPAEKPKEETASQPAR